MLPLRSNWLTLAGPEEPFLCPETEPQREEAMVSCLCPCFYTDRGIINILETHCWVLGWEAGEVESKLLFLLNWL